LSVQDISAFSNETKYTHVITGPCHYPRKYTINV
jgi:hypothetical protein